MRSGNARDSLIGNLHPLSVLIFSSLIDGGFVGLWVITQWVVGRFVIAAPPVSGLNAWVLGAFQVVFVISTLAPVAVYVIRDLVIGMGRWAEIQEGLDRT
jgi:hypothetical protein